MKGDKNYELPTAEQLKNEMDRLRYKRGYIRTLVGTLGAFLTAAAAVVLLSVLVFPVMRVTGSSMQPALKEDQVIMCSRSAHIKQGDIIAFYHNKKILVKRVIGVSGDTVDIGADGRVSVNGTALSEPYAALSAEGECDINLPFTVPAGRYFVMGDDRALSVDSRSTAVGCVAEENIIGKVNMIVLPFSDAGKLH
ncbi:signal peptidase I [Ruminococcus sp.]|uniref:signal peptidase I n=1 Tax=Ruminococcus sp. TaxID=41978 RepID=UPI0026014BAB|nr:signal peptidase I [Ruminococcus sp.]MBQ6250683.1 signal peptidase I [Ruminococcus sp.]MBR3666290.1 signal peptidase I [Ruminococcus sp.]MBR6995268.1 signal peptidase I [Ruminococcus sp.]